MDYAQIDTPVPNPTGWIMFRNGKPHGHGIAETRRSLLIGYDMIPLRGLDETEAVMRGKGYSATLVRVEACAEADRDCYAVMVRDGFVPQMLEWSVCQSNPEQSWLSAIFYLSCLDWATDPSREERHKLKQYYFMTPLQDQRRRTTYARLKVDVEAILARLGVTVAPIRYCVLDADPTTPMLNAIGD